jgi:hypothetical protein
MTDSSNTTPNSKAVPGKPFQKGDPRINRKGRPRSFDALRTLALSIAHEPAVDDKTGEPIIIDGHIATKAEVLLREWFASPDFRKQQAAMEITFGKVPDKQEVTGANGGPLTLTVVERIVGAKPDDRD